MFLPDENYKLEKKSDTAEDGTKKSSTGVEIEKGDKANAPAQAEDDKGIKPSSLKGMKDQYMVLVGPGDLTEEIADRISNLDEQITRSNGFEYNKDSKLIRRSYRVQSPDVTANALVGAFSQHADKSLINVDMFATPPVFQNQVVVLVGREGEVNRAEEMLKDLDYSGYGSDVYVYDVKYADPRGLREELVSQVKGLRVTIPTASAGAPRLYNPGKAVADSQQESRHTGMVQLDSSNQVQSKSEGAVGKTEIEGYGIDGPFRGMEPSAVPMRLTLTGTQEQIDEAKSYLEQVDIMPKQVALELRVMELSKEDALKFGLNWDLTTGGSVQSLGSSQGLPDGRRVTGSIGTGGGFGIDVTATLDQIANKDNLIARPNLLALDGRESELFVGDVIRYIEQIQATQNGTTVITGEVSVGVKLAVLPRIGDGFITMDLRPMVSFLTGFTPIPGGGQLPQTSVRMSQNTVTLRSGETIAIGGLIQDQEIKRLSKIPILGDLPVLGYLFRQEERIRDRREVVFFLTAREVVSSEERATGASPRHNAAKNAPEILPGSGNPVKP
jgi:type II secretory pathway component GspD/PulD (secretin)